jgi:hypothetical protein
MHSEQFIDEATLTAEQPLRKQAASKSPEPASAAKPAPRAWKEYEKILFRIGFIFFIAMSVPNTAAWYQHIVSIDWTSLHYRDLYDIARFGSGINWFGNTIFGSNLLGYAVWINTALVSVLGGLIWTAIARWRKKERSEYNLAYYWLRVVVRYRAGIGIIGFGFTKLLPVQMPYPSLGVLNTNIGDLTAQKMFWLSIGIVPWYQIFTGIVEVAAGALLLFRKTTALGAVLLFGALADIVYVNFAYDGGVHVYSSYFVLLSAFLLIPDMQNIYRLFIAEKFTVPVFYYPSFNKTWQRLARTGLKVVTIFVFLIWFFWLQLINFWYDPYKQPSVAGVKELRGNYAVTEFRINNTVIPYSPLDTVRWQEATFEKWTTLTFRVNKAVPMDLSNGGGDPQRDINRTFELTGVGGGQRVFHYYADEVNKVLYLQDKYKAIPDRRNRTAGSGSQSGADRIPVRTAAVAGDNSEFIPKEAWDNIGDEVYKIDKRAVTTRRIREFAKAPRYEKRNRMTLKYDTQDGSRVILSGINENKDSIYVVLDRIDRKYALSESSLQAGKYD